MKSQVNNTVLVLGHMAVVLHAARDATLCRSGLVDEATELLLTSGPPLVDLIAMGADDKQANKNIYLLLKDP